MSTILSTMGVIALVSRIRAITGSVPLEGDTGVGLTRISLPLVNIEQAITLAFDGAGDLVTIDPATGAITGAVTGVKATGSVVFSGLPTEDQPITVNGVAYAAKASPTLATEFQIGADATETGANFASAIVANDDAIEAIAAAGTVTIGAVETGIYGNAITLAEAASNVTVSGATLTGGIDAVLVTGDGVDSLGDARAAAGKIHGILILCASGSITVGGGVVQDTLAVGGSFQVLSVPGRTDLLADLEITSAAPNTSCRIEIRASE